MINIEYQFGCHARGSAPRVLSSLWRAARGPDVGYFDPVEIITVFHAYLMHTELVSGDVQGVVTFPHLVGHKAREAWMRRAAPGPGRRDGVQVGERGRYYDELGVPHRWSA